jgi:hypothetical protein
LALPRKCGRVGQQPDLARKRYDWGGLDGLGTIGSGVNQFSGSAYTGEIFVDESGGIYVADGNRIVRMNDVTGRVWAVLDAPGFAGAIFVR